jgi:hypothetical protein
MHEAYDMGLEEILAEEQDSADFENVDDWREEIDMGIAEVKGDLYFVHADAYLEEIEKGMDEFRGKPELDDHLDWQAEVGQAIDKARQNEG